MDADHPRADELHRIVRINEQIKDVVRPAFRISIMALNAILLSRRAGDAARGFGVLSGELRRFAGELAQRMETLRHLTSDSVVAVTALLKQGRYLTVINRMAGVDDRTTRQIDQVRLRQQQGIERQRADIRQMRLALQQQIVDLRPLIQLGVVLARLARVEAAYGGRFASSLTQVSAEFSQTIEQIEVVLAGLTRATASARG